MERLAAAEPQRQVQAERPLAEPPQRGYAGLVRTVGVGAHGDGVVGVPVSCSGTWANVALSSISITHMLTGSNGCSTARPPMQEAR